MSNKTRFINSFLQETNDTTTSSVDNASSLTDQLWENAEDNPFLPLIRHQYVVLGWVSLFFILIGIMGNIFVIKILFQPKMRSISNNIFLSGLAISDLLALILILFLIPLRYILVSHGFLFYYELHTFIFPYAYPLTTTFQCCSIFLTVAACINRTIVVYSSTECKKVNNPAASLRIVLAVIFASFLFCIPFWFEYETLIIEDDGITKVYLRLTKIALDWHYRLFVHIGLMTILAYIVPLIILVAMNYFLVIALIRTRRRKIDLGLKEKNEIYITFILVMIVILFVVFQMPNLVLHIIHAVNFEGQSRTNTFYYWHQWANFLLIVNTSSNFAVYCFFGENFRQAAHAMWSRLYCLGKALKDHEHIEIQPVVKNHLTRISLKITSLDHRINHSFNSSYKSYKTLSNAN